MTVRRIAADCLFLSGDFDKSTLVRNFVGQNRKMMISIIVAIADNGIIGDNNSLLWHIREDMLRFKHITMGHPIVMGRKTFESIGRPLAGRDNIVVSRQNLAIEGCRVVHSLGEVQGLFAPDEEIFVIGGAQIYAQALPLSERLHITEVHRDYAGDTVFPPIDFAEWSEVYREDFERGEQFDYPFSFVEYVRK